MQTDIVNHYELYQATKQAILSCRAEARSGRKDEARAFFNFIRRGRIIQNLKTVDFSQLAVNVDISHLEWQMNELELEIQPSTVPNPQSDIAAIRSTLETVAQGVQAILLKQNASQ